MKVGITVCLVGAALLMSACQEELGSDDASVSSSPTTVASASVPTSAFDDDGDGSDVSGDPVLDGLAEQCRANDFAACDELWGATDYGSALEQLGGSCNGRLPTESPQPYGDCLVQFGDPGLVTPDGAPDDSNEILAMDCLDGSSAACDELWFATLQGSEDERIAASCGGRTDELAVSREYAPFGNCVCREDVFPDAESLRVIGIADDDPDGGLVLRDGPSTDFDEIDVIFADSVVSTSGESENGWFEVCWDSLVGWASGAFLEPVR